MGQSWGRHGFDPSFPILRALNRSPSWLVIHIEDCLGAPVTWPKNTSFLQAFAPAAFPLTHSLGFLGASLAAF